jgi:hypothetical protein
VAQVGQEQPSVDPRVGLCVACRHAAHVPSSRGAVFWRCRLADTDPRFAKYPTLPIVACSGYEPGEDRSEAILPENKIIA